MIALAVAALTVIVACCVGLLIVIRGMLRDMRERR